MSAVDSQISQIYRGTPIGVALTRSLNAMIVSQQISGATAIKIMVRLLIFVQRQTRRLTSTTIRDNIQWVLVNVYRLQCSFICTVNFRFHLALSLITNYVMMYQENFDESMPAMMKEHGVKRTVDDVSAEVLH